MLGSFPVFSASALPKPTVIANGTNTTVSGAGTNASPYQINATWPTFTNSSTITVSGNGTVGNPYSFTYIGGGTTEITGLITTGSNIVITGTGTLASPYQISSTAPTTTDTNAQTNYLVAYTNTNGDRTSASTGATTYQIGGKLSVTNGATISNGLVITPGIATITPSTLWNNSGVLQWGSSVNAAGTMGSIPAFSTAPFTGTATSSPDGTSGQTVTFTFSQVGSLVTLSWPEFSTTAVNGSLNADYSFNLSPAIPPGFYLPATIARFVGSVLVGASASPTSKMLATISVGPASGPFVSFSLVQGFAWINGSLATVPTGSVSWSLV